MKKIIQYLKKAFYSLNSRTSLSYELLAHYLAKFAKCHSYVETFSKSADSLHNWIKQSYECDFKRAFEIQVRKAIRRLNIKFAD